MGTLIYFYNKMGIEPNRKAVMGWRMEERNFALRRLFLETRKCLIVKLKC